MGNYLHALTWLKSHTLSLHPHIEIIILCQSSIFGLFGSSQALTLKDNVLSIFSYDSFCQICYNFRINSLSVSLY